MKLVISCFRQLERRILTFRLVQCSNRKFPDELVEPPERLQLKDMPFPTEMFVVSDKGKKEILDVQQPHLPCP